MSNAEKGRRSGAIARIIIWSVVLVLVLGIFCSLMVGGNVFGHDWKELPVIHFGTDYWYDDTGYTAGNATVTEKIRELDIDWLDGSVAVAVTADDSADTLTVTETTSAGATPEEEVALRWRLRDGRLSIRYARPRRFVVSSQNLHKSLEVRIPAAWLDGLSKMEIDAVSADMKVDTGDAEPVCDLTVETISGNVQVRGSYDALDVDSVSGDVSISLTHAARSVEVETTSGAVSVAGAMNELELDTVSGDMEVTLADAARSVKVDTTSGELRLTIPVGVSGFTVSLDSVSGDIEIEDFAVKSRKDVRTYGDGSMEIEMDSVSGDLIIRATGGDDR